MISREQNLAVIAELTERLQEDIGDIEREVTSEAIYSATIMEALMSGNLDDLPVAEPAKRSKWSKLWPFSR